MFTPVLHLVPACVSSCLTQVYNVFVTFYTEIRHSLKTATKINCFLSPRVASRTLYSAESSLTRFPAFDAGLLCRVFGPCHDFIRPYSETSHSLLSLFSFSASFLQFFLFSNYCYSFLLLFHLDLCSYSSFLPCASSSFSASSFVFFICFVSATPLCVLQQQLTSHGSTLLIFIPFVVLQNITNSIIKYKKRRENFFIGIDYSIIKFYI